jgi:hypothetical protein
MNLIARIVAIGCSGLFMGTTLAATLNWAMPPKLMVAGMVAIVVWVLLGRIADPRPKRQSDA